VEVRFAIAALTLAVQLPGAPALGAQRADSSVSENLAPGVTHTRLVRPAGPWVVNVLTIDLRRRDLELRNVRALDALRGRETTSAMVARLESRGESVLAAVNGDFFNLKTGENENNEVVDGEWWRGLTVTDSPADSSGSVHAQFALDTAGRPLMDRFVLRGAVLARGDSIPLRALNAVPRAANSAALFTARYGAPEVPDSVRTSVEIQLAAIGRRADTLLYVRAARRPGGAVLAGYESFAWRVGAIHGDDTLQVVLRTAPATPPLALLVGGWPRLVQGGVNVAAAAAQPEGALPERFAGRNPRTAVGFSRDSATLWLVTVDGRSTESAGMTTVELADFMRGLGAYDALNLDGGGSATMVVHDRVVSVPSDSAGERPVGDALVIVRHAGGPHGAPPAIPVLDSARLLADMSALAADSMEGRRIGTAGGARARAFLLRAITAIGLSPARDSFPMHFSARSLLAGAVNGVNLAAVVRGTVHADRYVVLSAHYDHLGVRDGAIYNGADDNASGAAALLEMARWFKAHPPANSIVFAWFDGEEEGLLGAKAFLERPPVPVGRVVANVNLDMVSRNVKGELYASGATPYPVMKPLLDSVAAIAPVTLLLGHDTGLGESNWIQQSDQGAFASRGIPFVYFGVEDHPDYHTPRDTMAHIQPGFYYRCVRTITEFVRRLDSGLDRVAAVRGREGADAPPAVGAGRATATAPAPAPGA
jgi:hypothetical protein